MWFFSSKLDVFYLAEFGAVLMQFAVCVEDLLHWLVLKCLEFETFGQLCFRFFELAATNTTWEQHDLYHIGGLGINPTICVGDFMGRLKLRKHLNKS